MDQKRAQSDALKKTHVDARKLDRAVIPSDDYIVPVQSTAESWDTNSVISWDSNSLLHTFILCIYLRKGDGARIFAVDNDRSVDYNVRRPASYLHAILHPGEVGMWRGDGGTLKFNIQVATRVGHVLWLLHDAWR